MEIEESMSFEQSTTSNHTNPSPHRLNPQLRLTLAGSKPITTSHLVSKVLARPKESPRAD